MSRRQEQFGFDRGSRRYKNLRAQFKQRCRSTRAVCHICNEAIDYDAPRGHPRSFTVDHLIPASVRPDLFMVVENWAPCCHEDNVRRRTKALDQIPRHVPVVKWVRPNWLLVLVALVWSTR
jgi:hypothetical protein